MGDYLLFNSKFGVQNCHKTKKEQIISLMKRHIPEGSNICYRGTTGLEERWRGSSPPALTVEDMECVYTPAFRDDLTGEKKPYSPR